MTMVPIRKILYHSGVQLGAKALNLTFSLIITIILTRRLGVAGYGQYALIMALIGFLTVLANWGSQIIGTRELSRVQKLGPVLGSLIILRLLLALISLTIGWLIINFSPWFAAIRGAALLGLLIVLTINLETSWLCLLRSQLKFDRQALISIWGGIIFLVSTLVFLHWRSGLLAPLFGWLLAKISNNLLLILSSKPLIRSPIRCQLRTMHQLFMASWPVGALLILFTAYDRAVDSFFIKHFWTDSQVGLYGLAYKIYSNLVLPAYFLVNSIFPTLSKKEKGSFELAFKQVVLIISLGLAFGLPLILLLSPIIIKIVAGPQFLAAAPVLRILSLALIFAAWNHLTGFSLIALDQQKTALKINFLALSWNLALNWIFIPHQGIEAAAWITVSTEGLVALLSSLKLNQIKKGFKKEPQLPPLAFGE